MQRNNRFRKFESKKFPEPQKFHKEVVDGKVVFVEGTGPNPYEGISASSLTLGARIDSGVFESHEGSPRHLEKAQGSDIMEKEIESEIRKRKEFQVKAVEESNRRRYVAARAKILKEAEQAANKNNDTV